jgi:hypothetical protein
MRRPDLRRHRSRIHCQEALVQGSCLFEPALQNANAGHELERFCIVRVSERVSEQRSFNFADPALLDALFDAGKRVDPGSLFLRQNELAREQRY